MFLPDRVPVTSPEVAQEAQLVGNRGLLHADGLCEVRYWAGTFAQPDEDQQTADIPSGKAFDSQVSHM
jgi:hypothetical protein